MVNLQPSSGSASISIQISGLSSSSSSVSSQEFTNELTQAFATALKQLGVNPSSVQLSVDASPGQTSVSGQDSAASGTPRSTAPASTATSTPSVNQSTVGFNALVPKTDPVTSAVVQGASASAASSQTETSSQAEIAAFWAGQPTAVQALQNVGSLSQRESMAAQLQSEGYQIDVPVMVWGWDPAITTALRQSYGYTWVPAAGQGPVEAAPGLTAPGMTPYDPNNPPAGSIQV